MVTDEAAEFFVQTPTDRVSLTLDGITWILDNCLPDAPDVAATHLAFTTAAPGSTIPVAKDERMAFCARLAIALGHMSPDEHSPAMREADQLQAALCTDTTLETD
jgi:hypothetical protein